MWFQKSVHQLLEVLEGVLSGDLDLLFDRLTFAVIVAVFSAFLPVANELWVWWWECRGKEAPISFTKEGQERLRPIAKRMCVFAVAAFVLAALLALLV